MSLIRPNLSLLPSVSDPDAVMAQMTRQDYLQGRQNFDQFEQDLVDQAQTDTSLIDQAREDSRLAQETAAGIAERNRQRYGTELTAAQQQQRNSSNSRCGINSDRWHHHHHQQQR